MVEILLRPCFVSFLEGMDCRNDENKGVPFLLLEGVNRNCKLAYFRVLDFHLPSKNACQIEGDLEPDTSRGSASFFPFHSVDNLARQKIVFRKDCVRHLYVFLLKFVGPR